MNNSFPPPYVIVPCNTPSLHGVFFFITIIVECCAATHAICVTYIIGTAVIYFKFVFFFFENIIYVGQEPARVKGLRFACIRATRCARYTNSNRRAEFAMVREERNSKSPKQWDRFG